MNKARLKPGRDRPIKEGHPWVFSGAIANWSQEPADPGPVDIVSSGNEWLGRGLVSPGDALAIRIYAKNPDDEINDAFFCRKLEQAITMREQCVYPDEPDTDSFRVCFSEADGLSGLIVDRYADTVHVQASTTVLDPYIPALLDSLKGRAASLKPPQPARSANEPHQVKESGFAYHVDISGGQKTGFYLDQRVNRRRVAAYAAGRKCLSAYCYTGAFEVHLAAAGAKEIVGIDSSDQAIELAVANCRLNNVHADYLAADVPTALRKYRDSRTTFDMIILDPPKFVSNRKQMDKGLRAYKDINLLAMKLLNPGGILATFSCSGWVKPDAFRTALHWAAIDAGRNVQILEQLSQPPDHPVLLSFPESEYLCGYIMRVE